MGLHNNNASEGGNMIFVKVRMGKEGENPGLFQREQIDGQWTNTRINQDTASGTISKVKTQVNKHDKWGTMRSVSVTLKEPMEDPVNIEIPIQSSTMSAINSLLSCEIGQFVNIQPGYRKSKNNSMSKTIWVTGEDKKTISWAYELGELPEVKVVEIKGTKMYDDDLRMDFLVAKLKDRFEVDDQPEPATNQLEPATVADDDDLPF